MLCHKYRNPESDWQFYSLYLRSETNWNGLSHCLPVAIENFAFQISNYGGQECDNGRNIKNQITGKQMLMFYINCRVLLTPYNSKTVSLCAIFQRIYKIFAASPIMWRILTARASFLIPKPFVYSRWECRVKNARPSHYQTRDLNNTLSGVDENSDNSKVNAKLESPVNYKIQKF